LKSGILPASPTFHAEKGTDVFLVVKNQYVKNVSKSIFENNKVRVLEVVSKPIDVAKMHSHPDQVVYAVKGGKMKLTSGGKTIEMELKDGSVNFFEAQDHEVKNSGKTTQHLIVVELKK
jgi:quercetin dioxygenase-like cupin family protein